MTYKSVRPEREDFQSRHYRKPNPGFFDLKEHRRNARINRVLNKQQ